MSHVEVLTSRTSPLGMTAWQSDPTRLCLTMPMSCPRRHTWLSILCPLLLSSLEAFGCALGSQAAVWCCSRCVLETKPKLSAGLGHFKAERALHLAILASGLRQSTPATHAIVDAVATVSGTLFVDKDLVQHTHTHTHTLIFKSLNQT